MIEAGIADLARRSFIPFITYVNPDYQVNWHHQIVADALDRVLTGRCRRLMVFEPPQNGKSEQISRCFPAYALGRNPRLRIIAGSYSDSLAQDMSRDVQKVIDSPRYRVLFPKTRLAEARDPEKRTQGMFNVVGTRGHYVSVGMMGSVTGKTADITIIDDPIKNRAEAESKVFRDRVWEQYKTAFTTRQFGNEGCIILCLTRWHEDDLAGRLLKLAAENPEADQWEVISFPAIAEGNLHARDPRQQGEPLWPAKYPLPELMRRKAGLGAYDWSALYQQGPAPSGGGLFKEEWFANRIVDAAPILMRIARGWDTAGTENDGDYTAGVKIGEEFQADPTTGVVASTGRFIVLDAKRKQLGPGGVDKFIKLTADLDGKACPIREEREGGSAGVAVIHARTKMLAGWDYKGVVVTGSKVVRSKPFRAQCEAGNVFLLRGAWNAEYISELCGFPTGEHDDQVDGSSCSFNSLLLEPVPEPAGVLW